MGAPATAEPREERAGDAAARWHAPRRLICAGLASLLAGVALYAWLAAVPGANGWNLRRWNAPTFDGAPASTAAVPEPAEPDAPCAPFAAEWDTWLRIDEPRRYELTVEADDSVELAIDDETVLDVKRVGPRQSHRVVVFLEAGVHHARLRLRDSGGGKFLRVFFASPDKDHGWMPYPWPRRISFPTEAAARAAPPPLAPVSRAALFGLALLLSLGGLGTLLLARMRAQPDRADLLAGLAVFAVALIARATGLAASDLHSDEMAYLKAGMHFLRNVQVGDMTTLSFRHIFEHPPVAKWLFAVGELAGGTLGAKLLAAVLQSLTCVLVFAIGRRYDSRSVAAGAGALLAVTPYFLGHGRIIGLDPPLTFFFTLAAFLLLLACERRSPLLHFAWAFVSILACGSRATGVWFAPVALLVCLVDLFRGGRRIRTYLPAFGGAAAGLLLVYALWPWLWPDLVQQVRATYAHWGAYFPSEWILGEFRRPPVWYYAFGVAAVTSAFALASIVLWFAGALRRRTLLDVMLLGWLVFPFAQSLSSMRQDAARYMLTIFPAMALATALGLETLAGLLRRPRATPWLIGALWTYLAAACLWMHPYELDYVAEWTGGPARVVEKRWLELPFWGEGQRESAEVVSRIAPPNARVWLFNVTADFPGLRPDLVRDNSPRADFLVANFFQYPRLPAGYELVHAVKAGGAQIGGVYRRIRPKPAK